MEAEKILYKFQMERYEIFKAQDPENGKFDVVFEIEGKKLKANRFMLSPISTTFESMLSDRWTKLNEPIIIKDYKYNDFKEFLIFIYSGDCQLTNDNIFSMIDIAEFYNVKELKNACEEFLKNTKIDVSNIFRMIELVNKYSMDEFKKRVNGFVSKNLSIIFESEQFILLEKSVVIEMIELTKNSRKEEELFDAVYKWAETRAMEKQKTNNTLDLNETIKNELSDILPLIKFDEMSSLFFTKLIYKKHFLFSEKEFDDILLARQKVVVKIIDEDGKQMKGELQCNEIEKVVDDIASLKNIDIETYNYYYYWPSSLEKPSTPSIVNKNESIDWYLTYDGEEEIAIKHRNQLDENDYLLAEMFAESGFALSHQCKISVFRFV